MRKDRADVAGTEQDGRKGDDRDDIAKYEK